MPLSELEGEADSDDFGLDLPARVRGSELDNRFPNQVRNMKCPDCGARLVLKTGMYGIFYGCELWSETGCKGAHNCNKITALPLGIPGNTETRAARKKVHEALDVLWKQNQNKSKVDWVSWVSIELKVSEDDLRIASLDLAGCARVLKAIHRWHNPPTRFDFIEESD